MAQHFLLSAKARSLSFASILRMSDDEAHARFQAIRWADNGGKAFCPRCGGLEPYAYAARRIWKCKDEVISSASPAGQSSPAASCRFAIILPLSAFL